MPFTNRELLAFLEAVEHESGLCLFLSKTCEGLSRKGYFEPFISDCYTGVWKITDAGRRAYEDAQKCRT
jgi:hypothetical protein